LILILLLLSSIICQSSNPIQEIKDIIGCISKSNLLDISLEKIGLEFICKIYSPIETNTKATSIIISLKILIILINNKFTKKSSI